MKFSKHVRRVTGLCKGVVEKGYITKIVIVGVVVAVLYTGVEVVSAVRGRMYITENRLNEMTRVYKDTKMNFLMIYGEGWEIVGQDFDETRVVVDGSSGGGVFDLGKHKLSEEVVSAFMVRDVEEGEKTFSDYQMITVAGGGKASLEARLIDELIQGGVKNVRVVNKEEGVRDIYIELEGEVEGVKVYYSKYAQERGKNTVGVLRGMRERDKYTRTELESMVKAMQIQEIE